MNYVRVPGALPVDSGARVIEEAGVREEGLLPRASDRAYVWVAAVAAAVLIGVPISDWRSAITTCAFTSPTL